MFYLKNSLILLCSFALAFALSETIVSNILNYPKATARSKIKINELLKKHSTLTIYASHYKITTSEGGFKIHEYNNIGLPGPDLDTSIKNNFIFLLGNSFIEATTVEREHQAAYYLNSFLNFSNFKMQVINLGISTGDSFVQWFRTMYYEQFYKPSLVIFIVESFSRINRYLNRYDSLNFSKPNYFGEVVENPIYYKVIYPFISKSSFLNLIANSLKKSIRNNEISDKQIRDINSEENLIAYKFIESVKAFNNKYRNRFILISISENHKLNKELEGICLVNDINYFFNESILLKENLINGQGHLNQKGNFQLAEFLFNIIKKNQNE